MTTTSWLPKVLRWGFAVFTVLMGLCFLLLLGIVIVDFIFDHALLTNGGGGPLMMVREGLPGTFFLPNPIPQFVHNGIAVRVNDALGIMRIVTRGTLLLALLQIGFFTLLFDLLRRLFRNVSRGESFTRNTIGLVQIVGLSLMAYSVILAFAEGWYAHLLFDYVAHHLAVPGTPFYVPPVWGGHVNNAQAFPFGSPFFFTGLLVLAVSEVFRQGLTLKSDSDLTI